MSQLYTSGAWTVVPGHEEEFVAAWREMAVWTSETARGSSWSALLQHQEKRNVFLSASPWASAEAITEWRSSAGFQERIEPIRATLEAFESGVYERRPRVGVS